MRVRVISSSLVKGEDKVEGVEFLEAMVASSMRCWVEASSFRYLSKLITKSVMPSWCMTETSSAWSRVCTSHAMCLTVEVYDSGYEGEVFCRGQEQAEAVAVDRDVD